MSSSTDDYATIKEYLLGRLTAEHREEFERRFFADDELFEKLQTAEDDLIDDFLCGNLSPDDVELFQQNFLVGSKREQELRIGKAWRNYAAAQAVEKPPQPQKPGLLSLLRQLFSRAYVPKLATVAGVLIVAALGVWQLIPSELDKGLAALDAAYKQERPLESRITQLHYAPYTPNSTRGPGASTVNQTELTEAELKLRGVVNRKPTPEAHHALGKFYLARKEFDKAIEQFQEALKGDRNNALIYADLGAALLENGKLEMEKARTDKDSAESGKGVEYFGHSLENLNKALALDNNLLEALFNRALLHESMGWLPQAEEDWRKYLERDPNSKWADDARKGLARIEEKRKHTAETNEEIFQRFLTAFDAGDEAGVLTVVSGYQNRTGNVVVERLLDAYLEAVTRNKKDDADHARQRLSYVAEVQMRKSGDRFFVDLARFYESANVQQRELVLQARAMMKKGYADWAKVSFNENLGVFENAKELFEQAGNYPEASLAEYWMSFCHHLENRQKESRQILDPLLSEFEKQHYLWLQVRAYYLLSSIEFKVNEHSKAVDAGLKSAHLATTIGDSVGLLNAIGVLIEYYRYLGSYAKSLTWIQRGLPLISARRDLFQLIRYFTLSASAFAIIGLHDAALGYQREALRFALETGSDAAKSQNYAFLGAILGKTKNFEEGLKNVQLAYDLAQAHATERVYTGMKAYSALQMGNIHRDAGEFDKAVARYTESINLYESLDDFWTHLYQAHKGRFLCYLQQQNDHLAQVEISILFDLMKKYHRQIYDEDCRNSFFDIEQSVVDAAIDFEYSRRNSDQAFNYSNLSRARSLLDMVNADSDVTAKVQDPATKFQEVSEPRSLATIKEQLPEQTQVVQYAVLENKLLIWVISRNNADVKMLPISRKELNEKLQRYLNIISRRPEGDDAQELLLAKELYAILIQPVETLLDKQKLICIIPDGPLSFVPFASLVSTQSGRYLFEDHLLMTSPSASVFLTCSENALQNSESKQETVLSVGNPTFDRAAFPNFNYLPEATREALEVSRYYNSHGPLTEDRATRAAVNREFEKSDVIHLALHSQLDDEVPLRSKLLLAATSKSRTMDQPSDSVIYAYEIYNLKLSHTRLVVLSACQSGSGRYYGGEGVSSLARAFISAGVPLVVSSLWPVDSGATEKLMVNFHSHRTQGRLSTVKALRKAQHQMAYGSTENLRRPYYWAAFTLTGGYAEF